MQEPCVSSQQGAIVLLWQADALSQYFPHMLPITKCFHLFGVIFLKEGDLLLSRPDATVFPKYNTIPKVSGSLMRIKI